MSDHELPVIAVPNIVFFPKTSIDIFINQSGHLKMIEEFRRQDKHIVLSLGIPVNSHVSQKGDESPSPFSGEKRIVYAPARISTSGQITSLKLIDTQSARLTIKGFQRIIIQHHVQNIPYSTFYVEPYPDIKEEIQFAEDYIVRLETIFEKWLQNYINDSQERDAIKKRIDGIPSLIDHICHFILEDLELKQVLLENTSLAERVRILNSLLKDENPFQADPQIALSIKEFDIKAQSQ